MPPGASPRRLSHSRIARWGPCAAPDFWSLPQSSPYKGYSLIMIRMRTTPGSCGRRSLDEMTVALAGREEEGSGGWVGGGEGRCGETVEQGRRVRRGQFTQNELWRGAGGGGVHEL